MGIKAVEVEVEVDVSVGLKSLLLTLAKCGLGLNVEIETSSMCMEGKLSGMKEGISTSICDEFVLFLISGLSCVGSSVKHNSSSAAKNSANSASSMEKTCLVAASQ